MPAFREPGPFVCNRVLLVVLSAFLSLRAPARATELHHHPEGPFFTAEEPASNIERLNDFILNSQTGTNHDRQKIRLENLQFYVRLQTALNSDFNHQGDKVLAVVTEHTQLGESPALPAGSVLEGYVEGVRPSGRVSKNGMLLVKFYTVRIGNYKCNLKLAPNTRNGDIRSLYRRTKPTKKKIMRELLMSASRISIPLAIGSGGISLAITTGACAAIGCVLADDGKHVSGAVNGAWHGCGLAALDPVVKKGKTLRLPAGTIIQLKLTEPVDVSLPVSRLAKNETRKPAAPETNLFDQLNTERDVSTTQLTTSAHLISRSDESETDSRAIEAEPEDIRKTIERINDMLAQKDLARALDLINKAWLDHPQDAGLGRLRDNVLYQITGGQAGAPRE